MPSLGRVLIIAGSDSGGGAGIQADIKTVTCLGGYAATAITALTVQNTLGVSDIHEVPVGIVADQMAAVLDDIGADAIKTGMLHRAEIIDVVAHVLAAKAPDIPLVVDPVMVAKGGASLIDDDAISALKTTLIPHATVITPNLPEAAALIGETIESPDDVLLFEEKLLALGSGAALVKGGHMSGDTLVDTLVMRDAKPYTLQGPRLDTVHTHGTGCTTASAIATGLAKGKTLIEAFEQARSYVLNAIKTAPCLGKGHGPLNHGHTVVRS